MPFLRRFSSAAASSAVVLRSELLAFLRESCSADSDYEGAEIAVGELVSNVARHAPGPVQVVVYSDLTDRVWIEVIDRGAGFTYRPQLSAVESDSGRGLYIISQLCTNVSVRTIEQRTVVRAALPVSARPSLLAPVDATTQSGPMADERGDDREPADG